MKHNSNLMCCWPCILMIINFRFQLNAHCALSWNLKLIITQTMCVCDTHTECIHNMFQYTKSIEVNPRKTNMKMVQTFSLLWDSIPRSHKTKRLWLLQNLGWDKRRKNLALSTLLLLKIGDPMLRPYFIQTASNGMALKGTGVRTNPQKDAATNTPIQGRKNTVICVQE